ncbi:uncharacterized protein LOC127026690 [Gymnogyps californianus]|uniref:uncharacterized protein LOC127026690 n=1 Tax=Gymnogyps californianus TaxID=33616 RepID=UPI0021C77D79|nr:uncharacterized protein LOC127026690 [Gymnogyps californianus]
MRRCRGAGLAGLAAVLLVAVGRGQVQQEPSAETTEGTGISISCSHPNIQTSDFIHWYRQLPGRSPAFITVGHKGSKELRDPAGRLSVAADRQSSALWLARPRRGDAAVYYCALGDTGRGAGAAAGQEPRRAGPGVCVGGGGTAPGGPARGRCRSARLAPPGPARPRPAPPGAEPRGCSRIDRHRHRRRHRLQHQPWQRHHQVPLGVNAWAQPLFSLMAAVDLCS